MGSKLSLLVAVGGGKGGVGKSLVAANLAIACARLGLRVVAVDADLGAANLHTMFAIDRPKANLQALVTGRVRSLEEVVEPTSVPRLFLVPGSGGEEGASSIKHAQKLKLIRHIHSLEADVIVIDCGAGVSHTALDFFAMADWRLLVVTPQLVSLHNAYAFLKGAVFRSFRQLTLNARERDCLSAAIEGGAGERVDALLQRVRGQEPELALAMRHCLRHFGAAVVGNQTDGSKPSAALQAFTRMARDFLQLDVPILGNIARTDRLHHSVTQRKPFLAHSLASVEAKTFFHISEQLLALDVGRLRHERIRRPSTDRPASTPTAAAFSGPLVNYLRRDARHGVQWFVTLSRGSEHWPGEVVNASEGGLAVRSEWQPAEKSTLTITFNNPPGERPLPAIVRRSGATDKVLGLELSEAADRDHLKELLASSA